jgi:hypothetical protein
VPSFIDDSLEKAHVTLRSLRDTMALLGLYIERLKGFWSLGRLGMLARLESVNEEARWSVLIVFY